MTADSGRCGTSFRSRAGWPNGGSNGARRNRERVCTIGFHQRLGSIHRQACLSASPHGRARAAAGPPAAPALRRAVPALIIAFLVTICAGAFVQILDHRRQSVSDTLTQIEAGADVL